MDDKFYNSLEKYINHMTGKVIEECHMVEDEFIIYLDDGSVITFWSDDEMQMTVDLPPEMH